MLTRNELSRPNQAVFPFSLEATAGVVLGLNPGTKGVSPKECLDSNFSIFSIKKEKFKTLGFHPVSEECDALGYDFNGKDCHHCDREEIRKDGGETPETSSILVHIHKYTAHGSLREMLGSIPLSK